MNIFKAMKAKKKRAVDPNAPPRPNLMTHQVKIRDQDNSIIALTAEVTNKTKQSNKLSTSITQSI